MAILPCVCRLRVVQHEYVLAWFMVDEGLVLSAFMLAGFEGCVVEPLRRLVFVQMVVARFDVLRNCEDVWVGGSECAHAIDCAVDGCEVVLILLGLSAAAGRCGHCEGFCGDLIS